MVSDGLKSHLRTYWPLVVGQVAAVLATFLASRLGWEISGEIVYGAVAAVMTALLYSLGRWLETRSNPWAAKLGRFILSVGIDVGTPTYSRDPNAPAAPRHSVGPGS